MAVRKDLPPVSEGIAQPVRADASHASGRRREPFCPHHLSLWCSPANTPASQAGDHRSEAGQGRQLQFALKALSAMHSLGKRISPVQFRVRDPFLVVRKDRSRASAQVGFISPLCPGQHRRLRPFPPPCSSLRISFVKIAGRDSDRGHLGQPIGNAREAHSCQSITGWRLHSFRSRSPTQRHDVENFASAGATPAASTNFGLQALK
jgi:hypothetical protein